MLLGRNGSGKSTLLKVIAGVLKGKGLIKFHGYDATSLSGAARARMIGYLPQFHQAVFPFTVEDVVLTGRAAYVTTVPKSSDRIAAEKAIHTVAIDT